MGQTTYQVILSADGKHTVTVTGDNQAEMQNAQAWAKATYDVIVSRYGLPNAGRPVSPATEPAESDVSPVCETHRVAMVRVNGKKGPFWSCHEKNSDGSWCNYKPSTEF